MGIIPEETIEAVTAATDIVELIGSYIPVKRAGGQFKALCPFHNERTPSFSISPQRQAFHCFGCGASGSAIGFVMQYENLPFVDAVRKLADAAGIAIIEDAYDPQESKARQQQSRLILLHNKATEFMHQLLMQSPAAAHGREYLKSRGFGSEMAKRWKIGWMPDDYTTFLEWAKKEGFKGRELVNGSLAGLRDENNPGKGLYAKFKNRLMFPIHNDYGDVIAFSGRQLVEDKRSGKYINSNETMIFKKSKVFFGLDKARKAMTKNNFALLCEGQMDVIACVEAGIDNAIAGLGTALTPDHARILKRYTSNATLCFDADGAGYKAAESAFKELVKVGFQVKVVKMPAGEDPDSLIQAQGVEAFRQLVERADDFFEFKFHIAKDQRDLNDVQQRAQFSNEMAALISLISDRLTKDALIQQVAGRLGLGDTAFRETVYGAERKNQFIEAKSQSKAKPAPAPSYDASPLIDEGVYGSLVEQPVVARKLDRFVSALCLYALYDSSVMEYLCEQLESLYEPLTGCIGGDLLLKILGTRPVCSTPAALHTYLFQLEEPDRLALNHAMSDPLPENVLEATQETVTMLLNTHLQKRESAIRAALKRTDLSTEEMTSLLLEAQEIASLLRGTSERFIR